MQRMFLSALKSSGFFLSNVCEICPAMHSLCYSSSNPAVIMTRNVLEKHNWKIEMFLLYIFQLFYSRPSALRGILCMIYADNLAESWSHCLDMCTSKICADISVENWLCIQRSNILAHGETTHTHWYVRRFYSQQIPFLHTTRQHKLNSHLLLYLRR